MNRLLLTLCCVVALGSNVFGQTGKLKAYIDQKTFYSPETGNYAEVQIQFVGYTLKYEAVEGGLRSKVAIDIAAVNAVEIRGQNERQIPTYANTVSVSDILIAEFANKTIEPTVFSKSGCDIIPRISNFFPADLTSLPYYTELYNTDMFPDSLFAVRQRIVSTTDSKEMVEFTRYTKMTAAPVVPLFRNVDISKLPSGSYRLELAIMDRSNTEQGEAAYYYFERINEFEVLTNIDDIVLNPDFQAMITDDSVEYYMASLIPIARPAEVKNILENIKSGNKENCRKHLQQFWNE